MCDLFTFQLNQNEADDPDFLHIVKRCLLNSVRLAGAEAIRVVHLDNWFDKKWLRFSGKLSGAVGVHKPELTAPPFHPHRVLDERILRLNENGVFVPPADASTLHTKRTSELNSRLRMDDCLPSVTAWYSGQSATSRRAALMIYVICSSDPTTWYVGFELRERWTPIVYSGITGRLFQTMIT